MLSSIFDRAPSLPASELPMPSRTSPVFPPENALRRNRNELENFARLLPGCASLWPAEDATRED